MLIKRRKTTPSFGPDGRRIGGTIPCGVVTKSSNRLFLPGQKLAVTRAPIMSGLTCGALMKPFQRPMVKRTAYRKGADIALKQSSLGQKKRINGMKNIFARSGKGLNFKLPARFKKNTDGTGSTDEESSEEEEEDRPFEPLMVWNSPHQGGDPKGLPPRM